jgi:UDP-GlcNAc:undecaprenyl-phosphate/decaprenyl-phosphate GlcNAc-1-phosphate transferase
VGNHLTIAPAVTAFLIAFVTSAALVPLCRRVAHRTGIVARPRTDRWHREIVPLLGGVAIALSLLVGSVITGIAADMVVPLTAAMVLCVVGLVDDVKSLTAATKLVAQIAVASAVVFLDYRLNWFESQTLDSLLTIVWLVGLSNALNLLDNMDGLCAAISGVVALMLVAGLATGVTAPMAGSEITYLALVAGAAAGFLVYNFPPASIFMGDSGSLMLGFTLAAMTMGPEGIRGSRSDVLSVVAAPVFVLLIPIFDTSLVTLSRIFSGRSPARGGRDHSSHRLVAMGLSERGALLVLSALAGVGGAIGILIRSVSGGGSLLVGALFLLAMCLFAAYLARIRVYDEAEQVQLGNITPLLADFMYKRRVLEVLLDFCLISIAYYGAYRLRFEGEDYLHNAQNFYRTLPVVLAAQLVVFFMVGVYRGVWHYFGLMDGVAVAKGVLLGTAGAQVAVLYFYYDFNQSRTLFLIYAVLLLVLMTLSRASFRLMAEFVQRRRTGQHRAVIYGTGENAGLAVRELQTHGSLSVTILGFIDDDPKSARLRVAGYSVLGGFSALELLAKTSSIDMIVLARHLLDAPRRAAIEELCVRYGVALFRLNVGLEELAPVLAPDPDANDVRRSAPGR